MDWPLLGDSRRFHWPQENTSWNLRRYSHNSSWALMRHLDRQQRSAQRSYEPIVLGNPAKVRPKKVMKENCWILNTNGMLVLGWAFMSHNYNRGPVSKMWTHVRNQMLEVYKLGISLKIIALVSIFLLNLIMFLPVIILTIKERSLSFDFAFRILIML